jgi:hypothetical protein
MRLSIDSQLNVFYYQNVNNCKMINLYIIKKTVESCFGTCKYTQLNWYSLDISGNRVV